MGQVEFWVVTTIITVLISLLIWFSQRQTKRRDTVEKQLCEAIDSLKEAISQLKFSIGNLTTGCYEKHLALNKELKNLQEHLTIVESKLMNNNK